MTTKQDDKDSKPISDLAPEVNLPGLHELREVVTDTRRKITPRATVRRDGIAGLTVAIASVPDGMAAGLLAGVNPIYGLYASMAGPIVGGMLSSTRLMVITSTSATALVAGQSLLGISPDQLDASLFLMVILAGVFAIAFGLLGLGWITRFVSYSVMTGFLTGVALLLILSQLPTVAGFEGEGANRITQTLDLLSRLDEINIVSLVLAALAVTITVLLRRIRPLRMFASLAAIAVPTVLVALLDMESVRTVRDIGTIPRGIPTLFLPSFADSLNVITGAFSIAVIALVQGTGVSQIVPNPDGSRSRISRDFIAQGAANIASGLFRGLPVGGSLGATALNVAFDAGRRWAAIFAGLWMAVIVIGFPDMVAYVAMPALAALLIHAGIHSIKPADLTSVWRAGWPSRLACATTFVATLVLPIQAAVGLGVILSALLYMKKSSTDVTLVELVERADGRVEERKPRDHLPGDRVTVLDIYGHLFYAGARTLEQMLPSPGPDAKHPVVILRLRGRGSLGATLEEVLAQYARRLEAADGRLYLTGLGKQAHHEVTRMAKLRVSGPVRAYEVTPILWQSTHQAQVDADAWLVKVKNESNSNS